MARIPSGKYGEGDHLQLQKLDQGFNRRLHREAHQYGIQDHLRSRHSKLNETHTTLHVNWEEVHNHPAVQLELQEVAQSLIQQKHKRMVIILLKLLK
jgi:hypothetical protein